MPASRRLTLALAAAVALAAALAATPAAASCRLARDHACARPGASCAAHGRPAFCETVRHPRTACICATPIGHGGGPSHRK